MPQDARINKRNISANPRKCVTTLFQKQETAFVFSMGCRPRASKKRKHALARLRLRPLLLCHRRAAEAQWKQGVRRTRPPRRPIPDDRTGPKRCRNGPKAIAYPDSPAEQAEKRSSSAPPRLGGNSGSRTLVLEGAEPRFLPPETFPAGTVPRSCRHAAARMPCVATSRDAARTSACATWPASKCEVIVARSLSHLCFHE